MKTVSLETYRKARQAKREATLEAHKKRMEAILDAYAEGKTWAEICRQFGTSSGTILLALRLAEKAGDPRVKRRRPS